MSNDTAAGYDGHALLENSATFPIPENNSLAVDDIIDAICAVLPSDETPITDETFQRIGEIVARISDAGYGREGMRLAGEWIGHRPLDSKPNPLHLQSIARNTVRQVTAKPLSGTEDADYPALQTNHHFATPASPSILHDIAVSTAFAGGEWEKIPQGLRHYDTHSRFVTDYLNIDDTRNTWRINLWDFGYDGSERYNSKPAEVDDLTRLVTSVDLADRGEPTASTVITVDYLVVSDLQAENKGEQALLTRLRQEAEKLQNRYILAPLFDLYPSLELDEFENSNGTSLTSGYYQYSARGRIHNREFTFLFKEGKVKFTVEGHYPRSRSKKIIPRTAETLDYEPQAGRLITDAEFISLFTRLAENVPAEPDE